MTRTRTADGSSSNAWVDGSAWSRPPPQSCDDADMTDIASSPARGLPAAVIAGDGPPVVLVHGFSQTRHSWGPLLPHLGGRSLVLPDLPGHGSAGHDGADLTETARLVAETGGRAVYIGYSMGGRVALRLALDHPEAVLALVLIGTTAGIDEPAERAERRRSDEALADRIEQDGTRTFLDGWVAQPLFDNLVIDPFDLAQRQANRPNGLAASLRHAGTGTMEPPWWAELAHITCPTLVLAGEQDLKFSALGHRLADGIGTEATVALVPEAGHAAHLEQPTATASIIGAFLDGLP